MADTSKLPATNTIIAKPGETMLLDLNNSQRCTGNYFKLVVIEGNDFGCIFPLDKLETVVGRKSKEGDIDTKVDVELDEATASRRHVMFTKKQIGNESNFYVTVKDLESKNGTLVNDQPITKEAELGDGDKIKLGNTIIKLEIADRPGFSYHERLYSQVTKDALTGLWNHSHFKQELEKMVSIGVKRNEHFALLLMELDFLSMINETYGRDIADKILRTLGQRIAGELNDYEITARWSGTQFITLLPDSELKGALNTAERLRRTVESIDYTPIGCSQRVTMSIGVSTFPNSGKTSAEMIKQVEDALYQAKQNGHNRVCTAEAKTTVKTASRKIPLRPIIMLLVIMGILVAGRTFYQGTYLETNLPLGFSGVVEMENIQAASKIGGRVSEVLIKEGDLVKKGQPLVRFDVSDLLAQRNKIKAKINQANADLAKLRNGTRREEIVEAEEAAIRELAILEEKQNGPIPQEKSLASAEIAAVISDLANAEVTFKRIDALYADGAESKQARDDAEAKVKILQAKLDSAKAKLEILQVGTRDEEKKAAQARYKQSLATVALLRAGSRQEDIAIAEAKLEEANADLEHLETLLKEQEILAPSDCQVEVVNVRPGDVLPANKPVSLLLEQDQIWARIYVPETRLARVYVGQKAKILIDSYPNKPISGYVEQISQEAEFFRRNVQVRNDRDYQVFAVKIHLDNTEKLFKSGMAVEVQLEEKNK